MFRKLFDMTLPKINGLTIIGGVFALLSAGFVFLGDEKAKEDERIEEKRKEEKED